jgi:K(+)-stimulated pyrophosphate-energized sodium pump
MQATARMKEISTYIAEGAMAFLKAEWKILTYFGIVVALLLAYMGSRSVESHWSIAVAFVIGAFFSALAGYIGMRAATKANVRTAQAAKTSLSKALNVSFRRCRNGNGCSGTCCFRIGWFILLFLSAILHRMHLATSHEVTRAIEVLTGFSLVLKALHCLPVLVVVSIQKLPTLALTLLVK